jgi:predicted Zn-dependent peptidase
LNKYKITKFSNGITLLTEKIDYVNSFSLGFWFKVGSRDETIKTNGISHLLEHMFFKGTKKRSARKISEDIESLGGYLNAFTSKEHTCYYGRGLKQHLGKTFDVLSDMIQNSLFEEKELEKEAKVVIDELKDIEDSPEELIFDKFETIIFKGNTLRMPIIGTEKNITNFTRNDLLNYVNKKYNLHNLFIIASGAVNEIKLIKLVEKYFNNNSNKSLISTKKQTNKRKLFVPQEPQNLFVYKDIQQAHMIIGGSTFGYKHKERAVANLISNILGEGSSSRLFISLREKNGITYQVNTFMNSFYDTSSFGVYISTNDNSLKKAKNIIEKEFEKMKTKHVTNKELKRAKEYIKGHMLMSLESTSNRMMRMGSSMLYLNKVKDVEESIKEIEAVTADDILKHSRKLLDRKNLSTVIISAKNILD